MPRDGSGTYSAPSNSWNPPVDGTAINATDWSSILSDLSSALTASIAKDGQTTLTGNLPMGSNKLTGLANGSARTDSAPLGQIQDGGFCYLTSTAGTNTITATAAYSMSAYTAGQRFVFIPANTNTGATTININSIGAKNVFAWGAACVGGELVANLPTEVIYDGTQFHCVTPQLNLPKYSVSRSANQTAIATGTFTKVQFNSEAYDTHSWYDNATNFRFAPLRAGKYQITASVDWVSMGDQATIQTLVYKNGSLTALNEVGASGTAAIACQCVATLSMNGTTDYIEVYCLQNSGVNRDILAGAGTYVVGNLLP